MPLPTRPRRRSPAPGRSLTGLATTALVLLTASTCANPVATSTPPSPATGPATPTPTTATPTTANPVTATPVTATPGSGTGTTVEPPPTAGSTPQRPVAVTGADGATLPTRPDWLGSRLLPVGPDGRVVPQTTPEELADRRFATIDTLPPPPDGAFAFAVSPLDDEILDRSTWNELCPVTVAELRHVTLTFWGFDGLAHTGELIVNAAVVDDVESVFRALYLARFPIEEMRITTRAEVEAPPIGDGNNTGAFVCRAAVGSTRFSEHAYGLAIDINPFHNPYAKDDLVLPELAGVYLDRTDVRPGMIVEGDAVVAAFDAVGWGWGGRWNSLKDYQHFSVNNR